MVNINTLPPFTRFCCTIGQLPASYLVSLTYEEQLLWLCDYLKNTVIPTINNNAEAVKELQNLFNKLQNFVKDYFKNLDVQTEINNKLDEMVESGELTNILLNYVNITRTYNTYNDFINDKNNVFNNNKVRILGYYSINDGGNSEYYITNTKPSSFAIDLENGLYAQLIYNNVLNIKQFGAKCDSITDDTTAINNAILVLAQNNGGTLIAPANTKSLINGTLYICDNIIYDFKNFELIGSGDNTLFDSGYYDPTTNTLKLNYDPNVDYDGSNYPSIFISNAQILNAKFSNCGTAIHGLRLNYRTKIEGCYFDKTIKNFSINVSFSWGISFIKNVVYQTALFERFADWTLIENNSFEGTNECNQTLLQIGHGSYSAKIVSNGFHHSHIAINLISVLNNCEISNNHFETFDIAIFQGESDIDNISNLFIHNNWFYAAKTGVIGIQCSSLINSKIELNKFNDTNFKFQYYIDLVGTNVFGNTIRHFNNINEAQKNPLFNINNGTIIEYIAGRNDNEAHPQREYFTENYTAEKYVSLYNNRKNKIPMCNLNYSNNGHILNIQTFIPYDENLGVLQPVLFNILNHVNNGVKTNLCGIIMGKKVTLFTTEVLNNEYQPVEPNIDIQTANNDNKLEIVINAGTRYLTEPTGFVKAL